MPHVIGVTGRLGSGKSYCASQWAQNGSALVIEVDPIRHKLVNYDLSDEASCMRKALAQAFNVAACPQFYLLDTVSFTSKLFESPSSVKKCADICTPFIKKKLREKISECTQETIYLVWAYLIEQDYLDLVNEVILVSCPDEALVLSRLETSPYFTLDQAKARRALEPSDTDRRIYLQNNNIPHSVFLNG